MDNNKSRRLPWDIVLQELYAKGEVSEDVLHDADAFMEWWKSLDLSKQDEITDVILDQANEITSSLLLTSLLAQCL